MYTHARVVYIWGYAGVCASACVCECGCVRVCVVHVRGVYAYVRGAAASVCVYQMFGVWNACVCARVCAWVSACVWLGVGGVAVDSVCVCVRREIETGHIANMGLLCRENM